MTWYEAKLDQLRSMGVVDMETTIGCRCVLYKLHSYRDITDEYETYVMDEFWEEVTIIYKEKDSIFYADRDLQCIEFADDLETAQHILYEKDSLPIKKILWHPLTYGKWRKRIKEHNPKLLEKFDELWKDWSTTLSEQANKLEIAELIIGLSI